MPKGNRVMEPDKIGIPKSHPVSTTDQLNIPLSTKYVTKTPFIVQQAKQRVKANVFKKRILCADRRLFSINSIFIDYK
jgi:hypothetical protein